MFKEIWIVNAVSTKTSTKVIKITILHFLPIVEAYYCTKKGKVKGILTLTKDLILLIH